MANKKSYFHYVTIKGKKYLLVNDVVAVIKELGDTEPTDTRTRLDELADNIHKAFNAGRETNQM